MLPKTMRGLSNIYAVFRAQSGQSPHSEQVLKPSTSNFGARADCDGSPHVTGGHIVPRAGRIGRLQNSMVSPDVDHRDLNRPLLFVFLLFFGRLRGRIVGRRVPFGAGRPGSFAPRAGRQFARARNRSVGAGDAGGGSVLFVSRTALKARRHPTGRRPTEAVAQVARLIVTVENAVRIFASGKTQKVRQKTGTLRGGCQQLGDRQPACLPPCQTPAAQSAPHRCRQFYTTAGKTRGDFFSAPTVEQVLFRRPRRPARNAPCKTRQRVAPLAVRRNRPRTQGGPVALQSGRFGRPARWAPRTLAPGRAPALLQSIQRRKFAAQMFHQRRCESGLPLTHSTSSPP